MARTISVFDDARVVDPASLEAKVLCTILVLIYMAYAALGRDVFFNSLYYPPDAQPEDVIGRYLPWARMLLCFVTIGIIASTTDIRWALSKLAWLFAPFCLLALLSCLWAIDTKETLRNATMMTLAWMALSLLAHRLGLLQCAKVSIHLIAWVCLISCFMALAFPHIGKHDGLEYTQAVHVGRWRGIFSHKNGLGPWAAFGSVFLFTHSWICKGPKLYWWAARLSAVACMLFSGSATSIVMFSAMMAMWCFFLLLRRLPMSTTLLITAGALLVGFVAYELLADTLLEALGRDESFSGRSEIWAWARTYFWHSPWIGNGFNSLGGPVFMEREKVLFDQAIPGPESGYYTLLLDLGIMGVLTFGIPYIIAVRNGFEWLKHVNLENRAAIEYFLILILAVLVNAFSESNILVATGFDGILCYTECFALMSTPKSPEGVLRGEFRLAKHRLPPRRVSRRPQGASTPAIARRSDVFRT